MLKKNVMPGYDPRYCVDSAATSRAYQIVWWVETKSIQCIFLGTVFLVHSWNSCDGNRQLVCENG